MAFLQWRRIRGARAAIQQCDLAEDLTRIDDVEDDLLALSRNRADLDPPGLHRHQAVTGVTFLEYQLAAAKIALLREVGEFPQLRLI